MARNISGLWEVRQDNATCPITVTNTTPDQQNFSLEAFISGTDVRGFGAGHIHDDHLVSFVINWTDQNSGAYHGAFDESGRINGTTFNLKHPAQTARWHSSRTF